MAANRKTVLIVDDDEMVLQLLERELGQAGFVVVKAGNGKEALAIVSRDAVDIIVSDISMPEMDGLAFCEQLRQRPDCADIPFIFLTVHGGEQAKIRGLRSGADDYLVKPVNTGDLITRAEILHDRIQRKRSMGTLEGNLREVGLCEILQLFELTRKRGVLYVDAAGGKGTISLADGTLMDAAWNDLQGEDALLEMFALTDGTFRFQSGEVSSSTIGQSVSFMLMEAARLTDELAAFADHIPSGTTPLRLHKPFEGDDADAHRVSRAIAGGRMDLAAVQRVLRMSAVRLGLAVGKLVAGGFVVTGSVIPAAETDREAAGAAKPVKILIAFTDDRMLSKCLLLVGDPGDHPTKRSGLSESSRVAIGERVYDVVCLRGEKRFAFMWELVLRTSTGALFLLTTDDDAEHAAFFAARAASLRKPVVRVCLGAAPHQGDEVRMLATPDDMRQALETVRMSAA